MAVIFLKNRQSIECISCIINTRNRFVKAIVTDSCYFIPFESILYIKFRKEERARITAFAVSGNGRKRSKGEAA